MKRWTCLGLAALPLLLLAAPTARADALPKKITTVEGITEYHLDNGLRVLLFPDRSNPKVTVNLTILVGSRHEGYGESGMAHLLEHMVFKGTPTHPDIPKLLKDHGAQFNGTTWVDRTNYFETMDATDENLEFGIKLEADRFVNSKIDRDDLLKEFSVVRSEFEIGEDRPGRVLYQRMLATAYEWHNYGKSTIGNRSDIERVPIDNLRAFYKKYYRPDNAVLVVAGKFDEAKALAHVAKYFGSIAKPSAKLDKTYTEEPAQDGERQVSLRRVGKVGVVGATYHVCAGSHPDFAAVQVLNSVLTSEPAGRLYKALVETKLASDVDGSVQAWHDPGVLVITAEVDPAKPLDVVREKMLDGIENMKANAVTAEEVDRARRTRLIKARELLMNSTTDIAITLSEWAAQGDWRLFFLHRDRLEQVKPADVQRVANRYLQRSNRTVGMFIPTQEPQRVAVPERPNVDDLVKDYKGREALVSGEELDPTPANLEARVKRGQLPSGVKTAFLQKKTRGEAVHAQLTLRFGSEDTLKGHTTAASFIGRMLTRGTKNHSRQHLQDALDKLGSQLQVSSGPGTLSVSIVSKRENLAKVFDLLAEVLREPTFPEAEFDILKRGQKDAISRSMTEPQSLASQAMQRKLAPYDKDDIRYAPTFEESLARLEATTVAEVRKLYEDLLGGEVGELAIVGDFDPSSVDRLADALKGWKAKSAYRRVERPAKIVEGTKLPDILTPDKANAFYLAGFNLAMTDADPDYLALRVASYLFGEGALSSRLGNRVRQNEGLAYTVRSSFNADARDKSGFFVMYSVCKPTNMDRLDPIMIDELTRLHDKGISQEELDEAKSAYLKQLKVSRGDDRTLVGMMVSGLDLDRTFDYTAQREKAIAELKLADVNAAIKKHLAPKNLVVARAGDFAKKSQ